MDINVSTCVDVCTEHRNITKFFKGPSEIPIARVKSNNKKKKEVTAKFQFNKLNTL